MNEWLWWFLMGCLLTAPTTAAIVLLYIFISAVIKTVREIHDKKAREEGAL